MESIRVAKVDNVTLLRSNTRSIGTLHLTPHHLIFTAPPTTTISPSSSSSNEPSAELWIPYPHISHLARLPLTIQNTSPLQLRTKLFECFTFLFASGREREAEDVWWSVKELGVVSSIDRLYAFSYRPATSSAIKSADAPPMEAGPSDLQGASQSKARQHGPNHIPLMSEASGSTSTRTSSGFLPPLLDPSADDLQQGSEVTDQGLTAMNPNMAFGGSETNGWHIYNPREEFARMGVGTRTRAWRFTDVNRDYTFSPTYPAKLVVPSKISDAVLAYAGKYRSKARIPALTYLHWANQATITRCSQPLVGFKGARSPQDERLVDSIFTSHLSAEANFGELGEPTSGTSTPRNGAVGPLGAVSVMPGGYGGQTALVYGATATNLIVDARPTANAMANVAVGAGSENMENYKGARKAYLGIENIHVMRDSLHKVVEALRESESSPTGSVDKHALRRSNWLKHTSAIMEGALMIVRNVHINSSHVLIHCSDGWDRTAQLSAVAQVCLDPFYRTIRGFEILIEKDWMSFGHKFLDRSGHLGSEKAYETMPQPDDEFDDSVGATEKAAQAFFKSVSNKFASSGQSKEVSPVFHQFLDCVRQIQRQYPNRFEFNSLFLETLLNHLYSCQFGNFIANNERQRRAAPSELEKEQEGFSANGIIWEQTSPVWDWLNKPERLASYRIDSFDPSLDKRDAKGLDSDMGVLLPDPKDMRFWHELFKRSDDDMNGRRILHDRMVDLGAVEIVAPLGGSQSDPVIDAGPADIARSVAKVAADEARLEAAGPAAIPSSSAGGWSNAEAQVLSPARSSSSDIRTRGGSGGNGAVSSPARASARSAQGSSKGGWGWAQISSGALNAISVAGRELNSAAKEIKNISSEAFTNLAPTEGEGHGGEMWETGTRQSDTGRRATNVAVGESVDPWGNPIQPPITTLGKREGGFNSREQATQPRRLPSEANPWATSTQSVPDRSAPLMASTSTPQRTPPPLPALGPRLPSQVDYLAAPAATWGSVADRRGPAAIPEVQDAFQRTRPEPSIEPLERGLAGTQIEESSTPANKSKSWDPLGAL